MSITKNFVCVCPNGEEFPFEIHLHQNQNVAFFEKSELAARAIAKSNLKTKRNSGETAFVKVHELSIKAGVLVRGLGEKIEVNVPEEPLTKIGYENDLASMLEDLPEEFRAYVEQNAWARGHSSGLEEVLAIASELVSDLKPVITQFQNRLLSGSSYNPTC